MFSGCTSLTNVAIPDSVTNIEIGAFLGCLSLAHVTIPDRMTFLGAEAFGESGLASVTIPASMIWVDDAAFFECWSLTNIIVESGATLIGSQTFRGCPALQGIFFKGDAPLYGFDGSIFDGDTNAVAYYLPGTTGWDATFAGRPTALWFLPQPMILTFEPDFGVRTNQFGFTISWATNVPVIVEACTNLSGADWQAVRTNTLMSGAAHFSDDQWTNYPARFYRLRPE